MANSCLDYLDEEHYCPHCKKRLTCCNAPPFHVGDGLGWGSEILFICLNDECSLYVNGWKHIEEQFARTSSYRYMLLPGEESGTTMMVGSPDAFKGCEVDPQAIKMQNKRYVQEKEATGQLDTCVAKNDIKPVMLLILDEAADKKSREQACQLLAKFNDISCIDPIRNHKFSDPALENSANMAIRQILKANFKKECPYCTEIIKAQAGMCRFCNKELK